MSIIINALAGTGKTFALVGGARCAKGNRPLSPHPTEQQSVIWKRISMGMAPLDICFVAFTTSARDDIKIRLHEKRIFDVFTVHGLGLKTIQTQFGMSGLHAVVDPRKTDKMISMAFGDRSIFAIRRTHPGLTSAITRLVQLCKYSNLTVPNDEQLLSLAAEYQVLYGDVNLLFDMTRKVLQLTIDNCQVIDFDDMSWLPIVLDMSIRRYDMLIVDEGQDLNCNQQEFILRAGREFLIAGDRHQAIYGFRGADTQSMTTMTERISGLSPTIQLPLTMTMRCSKVVVEQAQEIVPEFTAHPGNLPGYLDFQENTNNAIPKDMILCRTNAPLISEAFRLINSNKPVEILGQSICTSLISLVEMLGGETSEEALGKLEKYHIRALRQLEELKCNTKFAKIAIQDRYNCVSTFLISTDTPDQAVRAIRNFFSQKTQAIILSSIHQAKGLEADNVFIIRPDLLPHPRAESPWEREQEENLQYVAITRSRDGLIWVEEEEDE